MAKTPAPEPNDQKFKELLLYVAAKSEADPCFSGTKLNKLLYYSDFRAYRYLGASITGQRYQKLPNGPAPVRLLPIAGKQGELVATGECEWERREYYGHKQDRLLAKRTPDLSVFTAQEIALVDSVLEEFWNFNATAISHHSHREPGWEAAKMSGQIHYDTVFVQPARPLTSEEIQHGQDLVGANPG